MSRPSYPGAPASPSGFTPPLSAQPLTATLLVEVVDSTGAALPGVALSVVHAAAGVERVATTGPTGMAVVSLLQPGDYTVRATLAGFQQTSIETFHLEAGAKRTFTLVLGPGDVSETVTVTADAARPGPARRAVGEVFNGQVLMMTPVASRDVGEFAWQAPGAAPPAPGSRLSGEGGTPVNVAGAREASNNFLLDGVDNNDLFLNRVLVTPSLDAVQEFTLLTSSYDAEYGRSAGAQVNVVLKSGASASRGRPTSSSAIDRSRRAARSTRPDEPEPFRRRHQFGGTLGGPAPLLRGFFFAAVEGVHDRTAETRLANVPTAAERAGDFSASGVTVFDPFTGQPFDGNRIPAVAIDATGAAHRRALPAAQPRGRRQQLRLVAAGAAGHLAGDGEDRPPRVEPVAVFHPLYGVARRSHRSVREPRPRVGRLRHVDAGRRAEPRLRADAVVPLARVSRPAGGLEPAATRRVSGQPRHRRLRRARHDRSGAARR